MNELLIPGCRPFPRRLASHLVLLLVLMGGLQPLPAAHHRPAVADGPVLFTSNRDGDFEIYTMNPDGTGVRQLTHNGVKDSRARWSPDGRAIYFIRDDEQVWVMDQDGGNQRYLTAGRTLTVSPHGGHLVVSHHGNSWDREKLLVYDLATGGTRELVGDLGRAFNPDFAPDGSGVAYTESFAPSYHNLMWVALSGGAKRALTGYNDSSRAFPDAPRFSPDGRVIVFSNRGTSGTGVLETMTADGDGQAGYLHSSTGELVSPVWSPDGSEVLTSLSGRILKADYPHTSTVWLTSGTSLDYPTDWFWGRGGSDTNTVPPVIVGQPQSQTVAAGAEVTFAVHAAGTPPLHYQWRFDGVDLPGQTGSILTLTAVDPDRAGAYAVRVSNPAGTTTSTVAWLTVSQRLLHWESPAPVVGGLIEFLLRGPAGEAVTVEASSDLSSWTPASTGFLSPDGSLAVGDPEAGIESGRFYRAVLGGPSPEFAVSGLVQLEDGTGLGGVTLVFSDHYEPVLTAGDGTWSRSGLRGSVTITPAKDGFTFEPVNRVVEGSAADLQFTARPHTLPAAPQQVRAVARQAHVEIHWEPVAHATAYRVYWSSESGAGIQGEVLAEVTVPVCHHGPPPSARTCYYVVTAVNDLGESVPSEEVSATLLVEPRTDPIVRTEVVDDGGDAGWSYQYVGGVSAVAVGPDDTIHVVYSDDSRNLLRYARKTGRTPWVLSTVYALADAATVGGKRLSVSLAVDAANIPHLLFGYDTDSLNSVIRYAARHGNEWQVETVDRIRSGWSSYAAKVLITADERLHLLYSGSHLHHAVRTGGVWTSRSVTSLSIYPWRAVHHGNDIYVSHGRYGASGGELRILINPGGAADWISHLFKPGRNCTEQTPLAVDSLGRIHVVGWGRGDGLTWIRISPSLQVQTYVVDGGPNAGKACDMVMDRADVMHIAFSIWDYWPDKWLGAWYYRVHADGTKKWYVIQDNGDYRVRSIAGDSLGNYHVTYYDAVKGDLKYAHIEYVPVD